MFSYSGPALLIYPDGSRAELDRVNLIETVTDGVWQMSGAGTSAEALSGGEARIKLPTGGEADVLVSSVRVGAAAGGASTSVTFLGS
ncbi:hypothetical protein [Lentzea flava]|uniref:Uncharacterized protein n=1 Tax=Lentzea flava TaxID=103732 RepID=A0ABQ2USJ4_9PSEU|nr:hypothetical protein [Lentzea flava]MCP2201081.1 hypothetical protein [Lentzea flava]GGU47941.1 hypothetical protein GCM10010178_45790 [Lentzea flava]